MVARQWRAVRLLEAEWDGYPESQLAFWGGAKFTSGAAGMCIRSLQDPGEVILFAEANIVMATDAVKLATRSAGQSAVSTLRDASMRPFDKTALVPPMAPPCSEGNALDTLDHESKKGGQQGIIVSSLSSIAGGRTLLIVQC